MVHLALSPQWPTYLAAFCGIIALFSTISHYILFDTSDPLHCHALQTQGKWLDDELTKWQPEGCMLYQYQSEDLSHCLANRRIMFVGDSTVKALFSSFANIVHPSFSMGDTEVHSETDASLKTPTGIDLAFRWDPFLNSSTPSILGLKSRRSPYSPALLVLGGGLWHLRYSSSGGLPVWEATIESILDKVVERPPADGVVFIPVKEVEAQSLPEDAKDVRLSDIEAMNSDMFHRIFTATSFFGASSGARSSVPLSFPLVFNDMLHQSTARGGFTTPEPILQVQANLLLNLRCNSALPKRLPFDKTCCNSYPSPSIAHATAILLCVLAGPGLWLYHRRSKQQFFMSPFYTDEELPWIVLSAVVLLVYVADRTSLWPKEQKHFNPWNFIALTVLALAAGVGMLKKGDQDLGFLNRDQTDEWKGWMQIAILIYQYTSASKISGIHNLIRVLVAGYLFLTGYVHTTFYLKKADFGPVRLVQNLFRLNFLTVVLAYTMNSDYLFYYFAPLCSFWYLVIYGTLGIGHQYNERLVILLGKVLTSALLVAWLVKTEWPVIPLFFQLLRRVFAINWSADEWLFRVQLDLWTVYIGMLTSITLLKVRELRLADHPRWASASQVSIGMSGIVLIWWCAAFGLRLGDKDAYNTLHPYTSFLLILAFIVLRNASVVLRSRSSRFFAFVGRCSLETFILQYHFWLAGDTMGILQIIPGTDRRPFNMALTTVLLLFVAHHVAQATKGVTEWYCGRPKTLSSADEEDGAHEQIPLATTMEVGRESEDKDTVPPTPRTPRWLERLATGPVPQTAQRAYEAQWVGGLTPKLLGTFGFMWILNLFWPDREAPIDIGIF